MLDHHDVRLTVDDLRFTAEVVGAAVMLRGRWAIAAGRVLAVVVVVQGERPR